jgi:hypothetical protein
VGYFVLNPPALKPVGDTIKSVQEQFANILLNQEVDAIQTANAMAQGGPIVDEAEVQAATQRRQQMASRRSSSGEARGGAQGEPGGSGEPTEDSGSGDTPGGEGPGPGSRDGTSRFEMQRQIEQQVAGQGILAALPSGSGSASGQTASDILGVGGQAGGYGGVNEGVEKIRTSGGARGGGEGEGTGTGSGRSTARGSRSTEGGSIDAYISDLGSATVASSGVKRTGDFIISDLAPLTEEGKEIEAGGIRQGARDIDDVNSIVLAHSPAVQYCYDRELRRNPDLKGKIVVRFTITPKGTVVNPKIISSTLKNENVERCVLSRISRWDDFGAIDPALGNSTFRQVYTFGF